MRRCTKCGVEFEPDPAHVAKSALWGMQVKVCPCCVLDAIYEMAAESVWDMTDEEIDAELRADGVDVEAYAARVRKLLADALAERESEEPGK